MRALSLLFLVLVGLSRGVEVLSGSGKVLSPSENPSAKEGFPKGFGRAGWKKGRTGHGSHVYCPPSHVVTGGGGDQRRRRYDVYSKPIASRPTGNGWYTNWGRSASGMVICAEIPSSTCLTVAGDGYRQATAKCPNRYTVVGGGYNMHGYRRYTWRHVHYWRRHTWRRSDFVPVIYDNRPTDDGQGWYVKGDGNRMTSYARCCKTRIASCQTNYSPVGDYVKATCPKDMEVTGGGFKINPQGNRRLMMIETVKLGLHKGQKAIAMNSGYGKGNGQAVSRCCRFMKDTDLCAQSNGGCDKLTKCSYTKGSYADNVECGKCPKGYTGHGSKGCDDVNECRTDNGDCDALTKCINTVGSFKCGPCPKGYIGTGKSGCNDIDECSNGAATCDKNTVCVNTPGSWTCSFCPKGYRKWRGTKECEDVNECVKDNGGCDTKTSCTNTVGSFKCSDCPTGWLGNGQDDFGCRDLDECAAANGGCDWKIKCHNTEGSFHCGICPAGYRKKIDGTCKDINECRTNNGNCHPMRPCINLNGGVKCGKCKQGFKNVGSENCEDVNECQFANGGCDPLSKCLNTHGGRSCGGCPKGYEGNGEDGCEDLNECELTKNGGCDPKSMCINTPGARICGPCPPEYMGEGEDECIPKEHAMAWKTNSKLDVAKDTAKKAVDRATEVVIAQDQEAEADHKRALANMERDKTIFKLDEDVAKLNLKVMDNKRARTEKETKILQEKAQLAALNAAEKVHDTYNSHFEDMAYFRKHGKDRPKPPSKQANLTAPVPPKANKPVVPADDWNPETSDRKPTKSTPAEVKGEVEKIEGQLANGGETTAAVGGTPGADNPSVTEAAADSTTKSDSSSSDSSTTISDNAKAATE